MIRNKRIVIVVAVLILTPLAAYVIDMAAASSTGDPAGLASLMGAAYAFIGFLAGLIGCIVGEQVYVRNKRRGNPSPVKIPAYFGLSLLYLVLLTLTIMFD